MSEVQVKICGITNAEDATWAASLGADYVGVNFWPESSRKISAAMAKKVVEALPPFVVPVGVFVDAPPAEVAKAVSAAGLRAVQLHGDEDDGYIAALRAALPAGTLIIKAFRVKGRATLDHAVECPADYVLLDAHVEVQPGGTGETWDWDLAADTALLTRPVFLAGGLTPENVAAAVKKVKPFAVDVASGVERLPRRKDYAKMKAFIEGVKSA